MENKNIKKGFDLLKIGIFLLGISGIIISFIALKIYFKIERAEENSRQFFSYCSDKNIIINANRESLDDVKILDAQNKSVCAFDKISANSEELCVVDSYGFFAIQTEDKKDIVECRENKASGKRIPSPID